jgi:L-ascorbate metabolism protein UlaG (beta-lactamase superfamily)
VPGRGWLRVAVVAIGPRTLISIFFIEKDEKRIYLIGDGGLRRFSIWPLYAEPA